MDRFLAARRASQGAQPLRERQVARSDTGGGGCRVGCAPQRQWQQVERAAPQEYAVCGVIRADPVGEAVGRLSESAAPEDSDTAITPADGYNLLYNYEEDD